MSTSTDESMEEDGYLFDELMEEDGSSLDESDEEGAGSSIVRLRAVVDEFLAEMEESDSEVDDEEAHNDMDDDDDEMVGQEEEGTSESAARALLRHHRGIVRARNEHGWGFLHAAVRNGLDLGVIKVIVAEWPDSVKDATEEGMVPLHFVGQKTPEGVVQFLIDTWRESVGATTSWGAVPLHLAASNGASLAVIRLLVGYSKGSVRARTKSGSLPIHNAAFGSTEEVVEYLWGEWPESIQQSDEDGDLPLHSSVPYVDQVGRINFEYSPWVDPIWDADVRVNVVRLLVSRWQEAVTVTNGAGLTPFRLSLGPRDPDFPVDTAAVYKTIAVLAEASPKRFLLEKTDYPDKGMLPLHVVCTWSEPGTAELVRLLLGLCRQAVQQQDERGRTPLHHAVLSVRGEELLPIANHLLDAWSDMAACAKDKHGKTPLHYAFERHFRLDLIRLLVERGSDAKHGPDAIGRIPLHCAIASGHDDAVELLLEGCPESLLVRDLRGEGVLHHAFSAYAPSVQVIQRLVDTLPESINDRDCRDSKGRLPLHHAVASYRPLLEGVQMLIRIGRHALLDPDDEGQLPLHAAMARTQSRFSEATDVVRMLIQHGPAALSVRDNRGMLPFHVAVAQDDPAEQFIKELVDANPAVLQAADTSGRLPVHIALSNPAWNRPSLDLIRFLAKPWPDVLQVADNVGMLPLHIAVVKRSPDEQTVKELAEAYPTALMAADDAGRLPVHVAVSKSTCPPFEIIRILIERSPGSLLVADNRGLYPLHAVLHDQDMKGNIPSWYQVSHDVLELVRYFVDRCRPAIHLADRSGRWPLHMAAARGDAAWPELLQLLAGRSGNLPRHVAPAHGADPWQALLQLFVRANTPRLHRDRDNVPHVRPDNDLPLHQENVSRIHRDSDSRLVRDNDPCLHRDNAGCLPLHLAVLAPRVSWPAVEALAQFCPDSLQERDLNGSNPFHLATMRHAPLDVVYRLLLLCPTLLADE